MKKGLYLLTLALLFSLVLAACNASGGSEPEAAMPETSTNNSEAAMEEKEGDMAETQDDAMMEEGEYTDEAMTQDDTMMDDSEHMDEAMTEDDTMMDDSEHTDEAMTEEDDMMEETAMDAMMADEAMSEDTMDDSAMMDHPTWQTIALTDARTRETFTLADFAGKTVYVEPMATWCTNCRRQLGNVVEARNQLGDENIVFVALSVETNISSQDLANYAGQAGFDWTFAVASPELLQELVATFGQSITNPPSTPHFVIRPDGTYTDLVTGIESPSDIISRIQEAGS